MKKRILSLIFSVVMLVILAGLVVLLTPGKISPFNTEYGEPNRIVSLAPDITEILFALGLGDKIAAVSSDSDYPAGVAGKNKVGSFWQPDTEAIIAARPDLVVTLSFEQQKSVAATLKRLGYRTLTVKTDKIAELWTAISQIGSAAGCGDRADGLIENIHSRLNSIRLKFNTTEKVRVLWVIQPEPLRLAGRNTFINELLELAGGENAIGKTLQQYPSVSAEELLTCRADVIIQSAMDSNDIEKQQQAAEKFWSKYPLIPAVKNNRIYVIDSDIVLRLGPRLPEAVELIAGLLHKK
jgi:iron complex transport system substrate-binding protein